ncbi:hypothetical protein U0070_025603 [Myodes glareolus]|uniref:Uncharacterized protein n=1 Tax=Myodes glareolus TaxID=447135 RepID=A0AAW0I485_MYOGA
MCKNTIIRQARNHKLQVKKLEAATAAGLAAKAEKGTAEKKPAVSKKEKKPVDVKKQKKPTGKKRLQLPRNQQLRKSQYRRNQQKKRKCLLLNLLKNFSFHRANRDSLFE